MEYNHDDKNNANSQNQWNAQQNPQNQWQTQQNPQNQWQNQQTQQTQQNPQNQWQNQQNQNQWQNQQNQYRGQPIQQPYSGQPMVNIYNVNNVNDGYHGIPFISPKSRWIALILCFFFGYLGIHRFYTGKIGTGILWLLTGGCFFFGAFIDFFVILFGYFRDSYGSYLKR